VKTQIACKCCSICRTVGLFSIQWLLVIPFCRLCYMLHCIFTQWMLTTYYCCMILLRCLPFYEHKLQMCLRTEILIINCLVSNNIEYIATESGCVLCLAAWQPNKCYMLRLLTLSIMYMTDVNVTYLKTFLIVHGNWYMLLYFLDSLDKWFILDFGGVVQFSIEF